MRDRDVFESAKRGARDKDFPQFSEHQVNVGNDTDVDDTAKTGTEIIHYPFLDDITGHRSVTFVMLTFSNFIATA